jgi:hypothetical protein
VAFPGLRLTIGDPPVERVLVRSAGLVLAAAVFVLGTAAVLAATDPHKERERLRPADMTLARRTTIKATDLVSGWTRMPVGSDDDSKCPGFDPDFSAFTITGKAWSLFAQLGGGAVLSAVEVYQTRTQAIGDFRTGAKPAFAKCLRHAFETDMARGAGGTAKTKWSRMVPAPRVGERSALYRLVGTLTLQGTTIRVYTDVLAFQRGRSITTLLSSGLGGRILGQTSLARALAARMR